MKHKGRHLFTSESVTEGHPDKMADQISDGILDAILKEDPKGRVACETLVTTGMVFVAGEITTTCYVDIPKIVRETIREIGYDDPKMGFDWQSCAIMTSIDEQSPDIAQGVDDTSDHEQGAGDQGLMFGYASNETDVLMPLPIILAHRLTQKLAEVRKKGIIDYIGPDGKSQVTVEYKDGIPKRVEAVVVATQHKEGITHDQIKSEIVEKVINDILPPEMLDEKTKYHVNETGAFVLGGPHADCGLTGRKIIVDTYGGVGSHGGGCFSGKDPSKVDRSASYAARHIAKNVVAAGLADKCEVQVAYAIGIAKPLSIMIDTFGTNKINEEQIETLIEKHFDMRPKIIINRLDLLRPIYKKTAAYGHFGREDPDFTWEKRDLAEVLRKEAGL
ncbi:MAG: methionine adenosyltransferase [Methanomassiliicoccales archaeon]|nr:MAG: methionine adenosyltransferase [Methanomassiliicoccales archaeon]